MNWKTFTALLLRDAHVARRNAITMCLQTMLQPLLFVFVFGQVMVRSGLMTDAYKSMLLPGIIAVTMVMTGIQAVSMPVIIELLTKEIEDRLLAPMETHWLAVEKMASGMVQALAAGAVVLPIAWLLMGRHIGLSFAHPGELVVMAFLVALMASAGGLAMGCSVGQSHIGLLFTLVLAPLIMFGCAYYPWAALKSFPILRIAVLVDPLVYASEGLRGTLAPQVPHMPVALVIGVLAALDAALIVFGLNRFQKKTVS